MAALHARSRMRRETGSHSTTGRFRLFNHLFPMPIAGACMGILALSSPYHWSFWSAAREFGGRRWASKREKSGSAIERARWLCNWLWEQVPAAVALKQSQTAVSAGVCFGGVILTLLVN